MTRERNTGVNQGAGDDNTAAGNSGFAARRDMLRHRLRLLEVLGKIPLFTGLSDAQFKKILGICEKRTVPKDGVLCRMGEESFEIFILLKGTLRVTVKDNREITRISPIGIVGEMGVFTGDRRAANILAAEDCLLLALHKAELMSALRGDADLSIHILMNVIGDLSSKLRKDNRIIDDLREICPPDRWMGIVRNVDEAK
jgi:CRP/FNR family transcriptional regulator, cyclic AMP receptor protein